MIKYTSRSEAVSQAGSRMAVAPSFDYTAEPSNQVFGKNTFNIATMKTMLSESTVNSLLQTIQEGAKLDSGVADEVAEAMKKWATEQGVTHFTHVFFPLTGFSAEKHDSFFDPDPDGSTTIGKFKGKTLMQGEPDASSFPNGGIRATHMARGYTVWDVTSPAYIVENANGKTLCIPTSFVSWTGESLDNKTPLLKSMQALDKQARRILKLFGHEKISKVTATGGPEQEYFLVDKALYNSRPDLQSTGRTLFGARPPKGQEFDDHYFGVIPERVMSFMHEVDRELFKLAIPSKTRHNEVAPGQYEIAPVFESANVAADHQQLIMTTLKKVADKHGLVCLLHEKPFAGVNGSGKHVNWSLGNATQGNLLDPGDTPHENAQFLVFAGAVIRAVDKFAPLLRAMVASAGNDHRLGANEAPPAIISVYLGDQLSDVFEQIKAGGATTSKQRGILNVGVDSLPELPKDAGDRNRTSPFAFTGNRFEFRAVGSNQSIAGPLTAMNTILCDSLDYVASKLEEADDLNAAIQTVLCEIMQKHGRVIYNGNGYSEEWHKEAAERGLPCNRNTADALPAIMADEVVELYETYNVMTKAELHCRYEVACEQYCAHVNVEANQVAELGHTLIYPAAVRYLSELANAAANLKTIGKDFSSTTMATVTKLTDGLEKSLTELEAIHSEGTTDPHYVATKIVPAMLKVREHADKLEALVADDLWPLPSYQEMLFVR